MAKKPTVSTATSGFSSTTTLNDNFTNLRDHFTTVLSRDGSAPNSMEADFDLNSNDLLNGGRGYFSSVVLNGVPINTSAVTVDANGVAIVDAGSFFTGVSVEDALQELAEGVYSVKSYGAVGDGVTDDTTAIGLAITAAGAGGTVFFPKGVYLISDTLTMLTGQTWKGINRNESIIRLASTVTSITVVITASDSAENCQLLDLQIDGNRANITPATDLYNTFYLVRGARGGKGSVYRNLRLVNSWGRVLQTSREGVAEVAEDILVENVRVENAGTKAISVTNSKRVTVTNCFAEVDAYKAADHPGGVGDGNAGSGSCFEVNDSTDVTVSGNHGIQIATAVNAPGIRLINGSSALKVFGNTIEDATYLGFIQNVNDVSFFGNIGRDIAGNAILIADSDTAEAGGCKRIRVYDNTIIDPDDAYVFITASKSGVNAFVESYIYDNHFVQVTGTPTAGIYNDGVIAPATGGTCDVYAWNNSFEGTIPLPKSGAAAGEIMQAPDSGWQLIGQSSVAASHTGDLLETTLATVSVPAHSMGPNGRLRVTALWSYPNSANNKITRVRLGGSPVTASTSTTTTQHRIQSEVGNRNSESSQVAGLPGGTSGWGGSTAAVTTMTINTTVDRDITLTAQLANAGETVVLESYTVEALHGK